MKIVEVACHHCGKKFEKTNGRLNESTKFGWKLYCSNKCQFTTRLKGEYKECRTCDKKVWRIPKEMKNSLTGRFFCSTSCAAIYNNKLRSAALPKNFCRHPECDGQIPRDQLYCSRTCAAFPRKRTLLSLKREVLSRIRRFYSLQNRIPVKKEMYAAYRKARDSFGTWNKAIKAAGFKPNPVMFAQKHVAKDGHKCDSLAEKIIDEWLHSKNIPHERSVAYPKSKKMTCDFGVNDFFIEFFGLEGQHKDYTKIVHKKRRMSKKCGLKLIEIKPGQLFPKNQLDQVLGFLI